MKDYLRIGGAAMVGAALVAMAPISARATDITNVAISQVEGGINIVLDTNNGERPEVFAVSRGNSYVADIINAQLRLAQGNNFRQENPAPGIAYIEVMQIDANSVRVVIAGTEGPPRGRIIQGAGQGIILSAAPGGEVAEIPVEAPLPPAMPPTEVTQLPAEMPPGLPPQVPLSSPMPRNDSSEVLLPDPTLRGSRDSQGYPGQRPQANVPHLMPRAVAPPVGDIAVSNINRGVNVINLNTSERIPRLVLRDAPIRDVLALIARAAGLNLAYSNLERDVNGDLQPADSEEELTISLDIENESVQDVFNYVLRLSGLQANRVGNTIFVGTYLPSQARNTIIRTLRLNQVTAEEAANFLSSIGAETQRPFTRTRVETIGTGDRQREIIIEEPALIPLSAQEGTAPLLLKGLLVSLNARLNSITLIGEPDKVDTAISFLTQLDLRKRQVAVNVKIIDINLASQNNLNSSFSFGINDTFFINDEGAASLNFGQLQPPSRAQQTSSFPLARPLTDNPISAEDPFFNPGGRSFEVPFTGFPGINGGRGSFVRPIAPVTDDPTRVGITEYTPTELDPEEPLNPLTATLGQIEVGLFPFILYPQQFLARLRSQITSGTGKILTDPTLVVQEGETATVQLVEQVVARVNSTVSETAGGSRETLVPEFQDVGLTLDVQVERIDDNGFITLQINPEVSAPSVRVDTGENSFATQIIRRKVTSGRIRLRDSQTLIISGIIQERERSTVSKIPILGDLPILGSLFRSTNTDNQRAEVIVLVTPQIMDDSDRSNWGYQYNPSPDAMQMMDRGQPIPRR